VAAFALAACSDEKPPPPVPGTPPAATPPGPDVRVGGPTVNEETVDVTRIRRVDAGEPVARTPSRTPDGLLAVGEPAPAFRVKDHAGRERTLAEFRGKRVVLWFFPKALTGG
jgi:hypothetical protein